MDTLTDIPAYGDHMTLKDWQESLSCGAFTEDDGSGYYATAIGYHPKTNSFDEPPAWATHVMWFNK